jgi:protein-S-isoprenylcysteine O-methyltransferase Ste14
MFMNIIQTEKLLWFALAMYWLISSWSVKKTIKRQSGWQRTAYILCVCIAFALLFQDQSLIPFLNKPVLLQNEIWKMLGLVACSTGLLLSLTARMYLGKNWSGQITIKENHELVETGPYRISRNPIYTGFLLAFCGSSMSLGLLRGYAGIILLLICLLIKISGEEKFMLEIFADRYRDYQRKVKKLIPFIY